MRMVVRLAIASALVAALTAGTAAAAGGPKTVDVAFVRDGKLVRVERVVPRGACPRGTRFASSCRARRAKSARKGYAPRFAKA